MYTLFIETLFNQTLMNNKKSDYLRILLHFNLTNTFLTFKLVSNLLNDMASFRLKGILKFKI